MKVIDDRVPCEWCNSDRGRSGTNLCDNCWEIKHRVEGASPEVRERVLSAMGGVESVGWLVRHESGMGGLFASKPRPEVYPESAGWIIEEIYVIGRKTDGS